MDKSTLSQQGILCVPDLILHEQHILCRSPFLKRLNAALFGHVINEVVVVVTTMAEDADEDLFELYIVDKMGKAGFDTEVLGSFVASAIKDGWNEGLQEIEPETQDELVELLSSAAPSDEDCTLLANDMCSRYARFMSGSPLPVLKESRFDFAHQDSCDATVQEIELSGKPEVDIDGPEALAMDSLSVSHTAADITLPGMLNIYGNRRDSSFQFQSQMRSLIENLNEFNDEQLLALLDLDDYELRSMLLMLLDLEGDARFFENTIRKPICKYFLAGQCMRADCNFSHNLKSVPCKHFTEGWCQNGDSCQFDHDENALLMSAVHLLKYGGEAISMLVTQPNHLDVTQGASLRAPSMDSASFPALPVTSTFNSDRSKFADTVHESDQGQMNMNFAEKLKLAELVQSFPSVWSEEIEETFANNKFHLANSINALNKKYPGAYVQPKKVKEDVGSRISTRVGPRKLGSSLGWLQTGLSLSHTYQKLRQEAIEHAQLRNRFYQEATSAFVAGAKLQARDLSQKGRYHDQRMRACHQEAAAEMFAERNKNGLPEDVIDLHGLHVQEALSYVEEFLLRLEGKYRSCIIVTGTGHHSEHGHIHKNHQARLAPAVTKYLSELGYQYADASAKHGGKGGIFEVYLQ